MTAITWLILIALGVTALLRRAGGVTRGVQALQRAAAAAQANAGGAAQPAAVTQPPPQPRPAPRRQPPAAIVPEQPRVATQRPLRRDLVGAFGDPAHARTAVILAEILAPPIALR